MTDRLLRLWLPGAASCLLLCAFYWMLLLSPLDKKRAVFIWVPYLAMPFAGALGAYLSRRMNGSVGERIVSALFPVFAFPSIFAVRVVYGLFIEREPYTLPHFLAGLAVTFGVAVLGGLLLALGAWPLCRPHQREQSTR